MNRTRLALGAGLLAVSLTACSSGSGAATGSAPATQTAGAAAGAPAPEESAPASGIPAGALLQPDDLKGAEAEPVPEGDYSYVRPLRPCGDEPYPSDESRTDAVAVRFVADVAEPEGSPNVLIQFVGLHEPGGAREQFADIRAALKKCPGPQGEDERTWASLGDGGAGDESLLVRMDTNESYGDEAASKVSRFAGVARVNDAIVVVTDMGWENIGGSEKLTREMLGKAVERAGAIS